MPSLMPLPERALTLPLAALAAPPAGLPRPLRECLHVTQQSYLTAVDRARRAESGDAQDFRRWQERMERDLLVETWQEAFDFLRARSSRRRLVKKGYSIDPQV